MGFVAAPPGWHGGASQELVEQTGRTGHFGGVHGVIEGERWDAPSGHVVLYVTKVSANVADPSAAANAELGAPAHATKDSAIDHEGTVCDGTVCTDRRTVIAATADRIVAVTGECISSSEAADVDLHACADALATLDPGIAIQDRVGLTISDVQPVPSLSGSALTDTHVPLPPITLHPDQPGRDLRPVYVGAGLIAIAAVFWWNRRRAHVR
jgi:hypothetical protein